ncbi:MAG: PfkB family carbohydrate kinase [bacterium]
MREAIDCYDLVFVGNAGRNVMHRFDGTTEPILGGPIFLSALATTWSDKRVAVVTRMAQRDTDLLEPLRTAKIDVFVSQAPETTRGHIFYLSDNADDRRHTLERSAGPFSMADLPPVKARLFHLAGVNRLEFPFNFMKDLQDRGLAFSVDMQALIRTADLETGVVTYGDYPHKQQVAAMAEKIKLDAVEAGLLTGTADLEQAAIQFEEWGTPEVMVTSAAGALVRHEGMTYFEPFSNRTTAGRTGRGDTTFGSYLARRMDCEVAESLKFAVALASIKMETPGLFTGTMEQVLDRMRADHK